MLSRVRKNLVWLCFSVSFLRKLYFFNNLTLLSSELPNNVLRYVISKSFSFPPEFEPVAFRELRICDRSLQYRILGQWGRNPFEGYPVTAFLCLWCSILSSKIAFEYETHKLILKQFDSNRHRTGDLLRVKADVITITPWNLKIVIARPWFLYIFPDFFESYALRSNPFDTCVSWAATKKIFPPVPAMDPAPSSVLMTTRLCFLYPIFPGLPFFSQRTVLWKLS